MKPIKTRELRNQLPEAGRIRAGKKVATRNGGTAPQKLRNFRFTSTDRRSIEQVAALHGGKVEPWSDPLAAPGQFEVITEVSEIPVALPPQPLSEIVYELWSGGGCQRRCDGEMVTLARGGGPEGAEPVERPCLCDERGVLECKLTTRLSVILPEIRFLGLWRLDTKGMNAARELPGMVAGIQSLQGGEGFVRAVLRLEQRVSRSPGQKPKQFVVPVLGLDNTPTELAGGQAQLGPQRSNQRAPALVAAASCPGCTSVFAPHWDTCLNASGQHDDIVTGTELMAGGDPEAQGWPQGGEGRDDYAMGGPDVIDVEPEAIVLTEVAGGDQSPVSPELVKAWAESLTNSQRSRQLLKARISARAKGVPQDEQPTTFDEIPFEILEELAAQNGGTPTGQEEP